MNLGAVNWHGSDQHRPFAALPPPVMIAWSTPGAALLNTSLPGVPYSEAIDAYIVASGLIALIGLTGTFDRLMRRIADDADGENGLVFIIPQWLAMVRR